LGIERWPKDEGRRPPDSTAAFVAALWFWPAHFFHCSWF